MTTKKKGSLPSSPQTSNNAKRVKKDDLPGQIFDPALGEGEGLIEAQVFQAELEDISLLEDLDNMEQLETVIDEPIELVSSPVLAAELFDDPVRLYLREIG